MYNVLYTHNNEAPTCCEFLTESGYRSLFQWLSGVDLAEFESVSSVENRTERREREREFFLLGDVMCFLTASDASIQRFHCAATSGP
jgi:hypothetical protein